MKVTPAGISFQGKLQIFPSSQVHQFKASDKNLMNSFRQMDSFVKNELPDNVAVCANLTLPEEPDEEILIDFTTSSNKADFWSVSRSDFINNKNNIVDYLKYQFEKYALNPKTEEGVDFESYFDSEPIRINDYVC